MNKNNSNDFYILAIDTVSNNPTASIYKLAEDEQLVTAYKSEKIAFINLINNSFEQSNTSSQIQRYDTAKFTNKIFELLNKSNIKAHQIKTLAYCSGPGPFSPIRLGVIFTRILKRINPDLQVYKFNLIYLLYQHVKRDGLLKVFLNESETNNQNEQISIYIKAGLKGYFKETYNLETNEITEKAHLINNIENISKINQTQSSNLIEEVTMALSAKNKIVGVRGILINHISQEANFNLSKLMIELIQTEKVNDFEVTLDQIQPEYLKEASVTKKKS